MPPFDWMYNPMFRNEIAEEVLKSVRQTNMERYDPSIIDGLYGYFTQNRERRRVDEQLRKSYEQRSKADALKSVSTLIIEAARIATLDRRKYITRQDFENAYRSKLCFVWPFC